MRHTAVRAFRACVATRNTSCTPSNSAAASRLPPIRYHVFREPLPYPIGLKLQNDLIEERLEGKGKGRGKHDIVLFLEHTPTYTTGRRDNSPNPDELHPEERKVQNVGAAFVITKRGGQVTYHGPGQLVGYPIMDLGAMETPTRCYVDQLQSLLADYTRETSGMDLLAPHPDGHVGVFASPTEKIASIGIHLRHRITSHGFAINISPAPIPWFDLVMACGLADVKATSLHDLIERGASRRGVMPGAMPAVQDAALGLVKRMEGIWARRMVDLRELDEVGEMEKLRELVDAAEREAKRENATKGGWADHPNTSRR